MRIAFGPDNYDGYVNFGLNYTLFVDEVDDGECTKIYAPKMLDYVPEYDLREFVTNLVKKMRHGCEITLGGQDLFETAKQLLRGEHNMEEVNRVLYGDKNLPKTGQTSLHIISGLILEHGLQIELKYLDGNEMLIQAVRE